MKRRVFPFGFTILEVLVAASVFLLVVLPLARLYTASLDVVKNSDNYIAANHLAAERMDLLLNLYGGTFYPGGVAMNFSGCVGYPFQVVPGVAGVPPTPTLVSRIRTPPPASTGPAAGEPRPICETVNPALGVGSGFYGYLDGPPTTALATIPQYHYDDNVYVQLDAAAVNTTLAAQAIDILNNGLDQPQIALAVIAAQLDPLDAYAIYTRQMMALSPNARIDGVEDYGTIIDKTQLTDQYSTGAPQNPGNLGLPPCSDYSNVGPVRWYEFGYRRTVCNPVSPGTGISQRVLDPYIVQPWPALLNEIQDSTKTFAQFRRVTEVTNGFYIGDDRNGDGAFTMLDYPNGWQFFFQSTNLFDPTQWTYGRYVRVSIYWKTGKQRRDPLNPNRMVDLEKRVQLVRFIPDEDNDPCDSGYDRDSRHYDLDPYTQNGAGGGGASPGLPTSNPLRDASLNNLWHNQERYDQVYRGTATPLRLEITNTTHILDPQCVIRP